DYRELVVTSRQLRENRADPTGVQDRLHEQTDAPPIVSGDWSTGSMTIERHLATVDLLCVRDFPAQRGGSHVGFGGPGLQVAELATSIGLGTGDGAAREQTAKDFDAWKEAIAQRLHHRWGEGQRWGPLTVSVRRERGEEIPEPWAMLSDLVHELCLWQAGG